MTRSTVNHNGKVGSGWPTVKTCDQASNRARVPFVTQRQDAAYVGGPSAVMVGSGWPTNAIN